MARQFKTQAVSAHRPGYPGAGDDVDLDVLLRGGLRSLFSPWTIVAAGALGLLSAVLPRGASAGEEEALLKPIEDIEKEVRAIREHYTDKEGVTTEYTQGERRGVVELASNPPILLWAVKQEVADMREKIVGKVAVSAPLDEADSYLQALFREVAHKVFAAYDINVDTSVALERDGEGGERIEFEADGFNRNINVGFEIRSSRQDEPLDCLSAEESADRRKELLEAGELKTLDAMIGENQINLFVYDTEKSEDDFLDPAACVDAFIDSLVNYLNWLRTEGRL